MLNVIRNQRGFTLIEASITLGLLAVGATVATQQALMSARSQQQAGERNQLAALTAQARMTLGQPEGCLVNSKNADGSARSYTNDIPYTALYNATKNASGTLVRATDPVIKLDPPRAGDSGIVGYYQGVPIRKMSIISNKSDPSTIAECAVYDASHVCTVPSKIKAALRVVAERGSRGRNIASADRLTTTEDIPMLLDLANGGNDVGGCELGRQSVSVGNDPRQVCVDMGGTWSESTSPKCTLPTSGNGGGITAEQVCAEIGGTYNESATPKCKLPQGPLRFYSYNGRSSAEHQTSFETMVAAGNLMPINVSMYGTSGNFSDAKYSATYINRWNRGLYAFHNVTPAQYQALFDNYCMNNGYRPFHINAFGNSKTNVRFSGIFVKNVERYAFTGKHGLTQTELQQEDDRQKAAGNIMRSIAVYGSSTNPYFAALWVQNVRGFQSQWFFARNTATYQTLFTQAVAPGNRRPKSLAIGSTSGTDPYFAALLWNLPYNRQSGGEARTVTEPNYQALFDSYNARGLLPLYLSGGGKGGNESVIDSYWIDNQDYEENLEDAML